VEIVEVLYIMSVIMPKQEKKTLALEEIFLNIVALLLDMY